LESAQVFNTEELDCAVSLFDSYVERGPDPENYVFLGAYQEEKNLLGFICYGKASLTDGVYDLYWIATDARYQKMGIASLLLRCLDERLKLLGARMVLAETSSRADYENAHRTYLKNGYQLVATIKDFYAVKNDMLVFSKRYDA
jgi:ribosomal protein S18 acetylase RimI-like enzyme